LAEVTSSCALVAADEEGGLPVLPAFEDVGAPCLLAHGVETTVVDECGEPTVLGTHRCPRPDPPGFGLGGHGGVLDLDTQEFAAVGRDRCGQLGTPHVCACRGLPASMSSASPRASFCV